MRVFVRSEDRRGRRGDRQRCDGGAGREGSARWIHHQVRTALTLYTAPRRLPAVPDARRRHLLPSAMRRSCLVKRVVPETVMPPGSPACPGRKTGGTWRRARRHVTGAAVNRQLEIARVSAWGEKNGVPALCGVERRLECS